MSTTKPEPIIVEQLFDRTVEEVWNAITQPGQMQQWFFEQIKSFRAEEGFETQFDVQVEDRNFRHVWKLTEVIPLKRITYSWKYAEYPGDGVVLFELSEQENQVKLTLTCHGIETFPQHIPEFSRESCEGGWIYFIKERLKGFLETKN